MDRILRVVLSLCCVHIAAFTDPCVIDLTCTECIPDNMPLVTSHRALDGTVTAAEGDEVMFSCGGGAFLVYPLRGALAAVCEGGRYRVRHDAALRHLLELGCQEDMFEDVLHDVEHCSPPLQGRAYQMREGGSVRGARHVATVCFDGDSGAAVWARATNAPHNALALPAHGERAAPLSLLGNFNHMFDASTRAAAERLFADEAAMTRRLKELFRPEGVAFADQALVGAPLLAADYFDEENARVARFVSNRVPAWRGVAAANLRHLQRDVAALLRASRPRLVEVYAGTRGVAALRAGDAGRRELWLRPGRFPAPRYVWTVVHEPATRRALALVLLNDPFVAVSDIREAVFCESGCGGVRWLRELRRHRRYEVPAFGLVFCCALPDFLRAEPAAPRAALANVTDMLTDLPAPP